jgi:adenine deaminase
MVVVERHHNTGCVGVGLVHGFNLNAGAIASSVAHDAHNIVAVGSSDAAIMTAIQAITATDGGFSVATDDAVLATVPLRIGGLLSDQPYRVVAEQMQMLCGAFDQVSHDVHYDPFITLSFLTLPVIPSIKLTDQGLFDFDQFGFIPVIDK